MEKYAKLTLDELVRRKEQMLAAKKKKQTKELYIPSLNSTITISEPSADVVRDCMDMEDDGDRYMCLQCVIEPRLNSPKLREEFGCDEPMDIVDILLKPGEISQISAECIKLAGYGNGVKEIKN